MLKFTISKSQDKALRSRGVPLQLALPAPPHDVDDPIAWAKSVLPTDLYDCIRSAEEMELRVVPDPNQVGLPGLLGVPLTKKMGTQPIFTLGVAVVLVTLLDGPQRNNSDKIQWPASIEFDGRKIEGRPQ